MCLHHLKRETGAHRVAQQDIVRRRPDRIERISGEEARRANVESGIAQKIPIGIREGTRSLP